MNRKTIRRPIAWMLVAALTPGPEWAAIAQTPQPPAPPAGESILDQIEASDPANMPSAQRLADVPDSMPAPDGIVDPDLSLRVAITSAVEEAGFDADQGSTSANPDGSKTFTGIYDDGNIVVTGRFVDGRLELRKEFRPLLNSGELGETIRVRHKPGAAAPAQAAPASADPAQPTEAELQAALDATINQGYQQLLAGAKQVGGPRRIDITETGGFFSSTGETFIPFTDFTIAGLLGTRDLYIRQLMTFLNEMANLRLLSPEARLERIKRMMTFAHQAETLRTLANLAGAMGTFDKAITLGEAEAAAADKRGDTAFAAAIRAVLSKPVDEREAAFRQLFLQALDQDALLAVGDFWQTLAAGGDPKEYVDAFNTTVRQAIDQTHAEINRVRAFTTVAELAEFLKPQYARTRVLGGMLGGPYTKLFQMLDEFASAYVEVKEGQAAITGLKVALFTVVVGGIGFVVAAPFALAGAAAAAKGIAAGSGLLASGIQLGYDGYRLYGAHVELSNARNAIGANGYYVLNHLEQQRRQAAFAVAIDTAFVALSAFQLRAAIAEIRASAAGARQVVGPLGQLGNAAGVDRGVRRARELGIPESQIQGHLDLANMQTPINGGKEAIKRVEAIKARGAAALAQIGQLDDMVREARAAGVTQAEIDAMFAAAAQQGTLRAYSHDLATNLFRATMNRRGIVFVADTVGPSFQRLRQFFNNVLPANVVQMNLIALARIAGNLRFMRAGRLVRWSTGDIHLLQQVLANPNANRLYGFISDERIFFQLFNDDLLATGRQFVNAPNSVGIAAGHVTLPPLPAVAPAAPAASAAAPAAAPFMYLPAGTTLLTGDEAAAALDRWLARMRAAEAQEAAQPAEKQVGAVRVNGDFNGDGQKDAFTLVPSGSPSTIGVASDVRAIRGEAAAGTVTSVASGDVNGDAIDDLIFGGAGPDGTGGVHVALGGSFLRPGTSYRLNLRRPPAISLPSVPSAIAAGDLDGDKRAEISIALPNAGTGGSVETFRVVIKGDPNAPYLYQRADLIDISDVPWRLEIGPSSGAPGGRPDGDPDLFIATPSGVTIFENTSQPGAIRFDPKPFTLTGLPSGGLLFGDVNHDTFFDVLSVDRAAGTLSTFGSTSAGGYTPPIVSPLGGNAGTVLLGDAWGFDAYPDLFVTRTGATGDFEVFGGSGTGVFARNPLLETRSRPSLKGNWGALIEGVHTYTPPESAAAPDPRRGTNAWPSGGRYLLDDEFGSGGEAKTPSNSYTPRFPGFRFGTSYTPWMPPEDVTRLFEPLVSAPADQESQYELLMRLTLRLGARPSSGPDFGGVVARIRDALFIRPDTRSAVARSEARSLNAWRHADARLRQRPGNGGAAAEPAGALLVTSLGVSTGEAFRVHGIAAAPVEIAAEAIVVEPLKGVNAEAAAKATKAIESRGGASATAVGYCLEFLKEPPKAGMPFRIAPREIQRRFEPLRRVAQAANRLQQAGVLKPDSDPVSYFHSITQWAMWAKEQKFDREGFKRALIEYTKKNVLRGGREWKKEMEQVVETVVPHRWDQIQRVLAEAK